MRTLRVALLAIALGLWPTTGAAANESATGFVDAVGDPTAVARDSRGDLPKGRAADRPDCVWTAVVRDDAVRPVYDSAGRRQFSETGRWLQMICNEALVYVDGWPLIPERGRVNPALLAEEASRSVSIAAPVIATSPDASKALYVQVPTWLWIDASWWRPYEATASAGRVTATVSVRPRRTVWSTGDGASVACDGPGLAWRSGLAEDASPCRHTYRRSSSGQSGEAFSLRAEVELEVSWSSNVGVSGRLPAIRRSAETAARVAEIQAVGSRGE